jgi:hypothetical protein
MSNDGCLTAALGNMLSLTLWLVFAACNCNLSFTGADPASLVIGRS